MPKIKFWKNDPNSDYPQIQQSRLQRPWMDKTYNKLAYLCTPLSTAIQHGWEIKLPQDIKVTWDGIWEGQEGENSSHVKIVEGDSYNGKIIANSDSGVGQITFLLDMLVETDQDHYLVFSGPPNYIFEDAYPLSFIWRSDFYHYQDLSISWKITTPNKEIIFPKGMPIAFFTIYPKGLLESTEIEIHSTKDNPKIENDANIYSDKRAKILKDDPYAFPMFYKHGIGPNNEKYLDKPWKIVLKDPVIKYKKS